MHSIINFIQRIEGKWRGIFGRYWQSCKSLDEVLSGDSKFFLALKIVLKSNPLLPGPRSYVFFLSELSFTDTENSQDRRAKKGTIFYSFFPFLPAHEQSDIYLQLCMWGNYHIFLITQLVFTRMIHWWFDVSFCLISWWFDCRFLLHQFDTGNWWNGTRIDYHPCITSEPTNQAS